MVVHSRYQFCNDQGAPTHEEEFTLPRVPVTDTQASTSFEAINYVIQEFVFGPSWAEFIAGLSCVFFAVICIVADYAT